MNFNDLSTQASEEVESLGSELSLEDYIDFIGAVMEDLQVMQSAAREDME